jgi:hypothetical protein
VSPAKAKAAGRRSDRSSPKRAKRSAFSPASLAGDAHEFHQIVHRQLACHRGQRVRVILEARLGHRHVAVGPVEPFGGEITVSMMRLLVGVGS